MQGIASIDIQQVQRNQRIRLLMLLVCFMGILSCLIFLYVLTSFHVKAKTEKIFKIAASSSFEPFQQEVEKLAKENDVKVKIQYLDLVSLAESLKQNKLDVDAIWSDSKLFNSVFNISNMMSEGNLLFYSPVTISFRKDIEKQYAKRGRTLNSTEFFDALKDGQIKVIVPSFTQTATGQAFFAGVYRLFVGDKFDISKESIAKLKDVFKKAKLTIVTDDKELEKQFLGDSFDAVVASEHMVAMLNKKLREEKKAIPRVATYFREAPRAVSVIFGFIKKDKEKRRFFRRIQSLVVSKEGQQLARDSGYRSIYSGVYKNSVWAGLFPIGSASNELDLQDSELQTIFSYYQSKIRPPSKVNIVLNLEEKVGRNNVKLQNSLKRQLIEVSANTMSRFFLASTRNDVFKFILSKNDAEKIELIDFKDSSRIGDEFRSLQPLKTPSKTDLSTALTKATSDLCDDSDESERRSVVLISDTDALDNQMRDVQLVVKGCRKKVSFYVVYIGDQKVNKRVISDYSVQKILQPKTTMYVNEKNIREGFWKLRGSL